jgi:tetratricopeptide (TPR) repeat protein
MKRSIWAVVGIGLVIGAGFLIHRAKTGAIPPSETAKSMSGPPAAETPSVKGASRSAFLEAIDTLVSLQSRYDQKEAAWRQLTEMGQLDQAITELEKRAADHPQSAGYATVLGHTYIKKCVIVRDQREQGVLAMKADQTFNTALSLDPSNWEARFTKAVALSHWPPQMNRGAEAIENFQTLIQQQEALPPQPHFAQPYVWLSDQFEKEGNTDEAIEVWRRGAALFPTNAELRGKLAAAP